MISWIRANDDNANKQPKHKPHNRTRQLAKRLPVLVVLGLAVHLLLPQIIAFQHALDVIRGMVGWAVGLAILSQLISYMGRGYTLTALVKAVGARLSLLRGMSIATAAASVGLVAGGMVSSAAVTTRWVRTSGVRREGALLAGWLPSFVNNLLLWFVGLVGVAHLLLIHDLTTAEIAGFGFSAILLGAAVLIVGWGVGHRSQLQRVVEWVTQRIARLRRRPYQPDGPRKMTERLFTVWDAFCSGGWRGAMLGGAINIAGDMLTLFFFFMAAGHAVSPGVLLVGYGLPLLLAKAAFFLPGGVGLVEGTMTALYTGLGIPSHVVVVVILAYRVASFWVPTILGFPLAARMQRLTDDAK